MILKPFTEALEDFTRSNPEYSHDEIMRFRETEYPALGAGEVDGAEKAGHAYLDYTGGNLSPKSLIERHARFLGGHVLGNPHSENPTSNLASQYLDEARERVLAYFNAGDNYCCVFTMNATAGLKIVGECYPFHDEGAFAYFEDNHNSVLGIRQHALAKNAPVSCITTEENLTVSRENVQSALLDDVFAGRKNKLFAFAAQSNATGVKHDLRHIRTAKKEGWDVLLDAAAYVPTNRLDLGGDDMDGLPDYVCMSFYKMFGYPTGVGCLLIKIKPLRQNDSPFAKLWYNKPFFAGGNVKLIMSDCRNLIDDDQQCDSEKHINYVLHRNHQCFEDGTVDYLNIPAIKNGLDFIDERNGPNGDGISRHVSMLMTWLAGQLQQIVYSNGSRVAVLCGEEFTDKWASTILIKFYKPNGEQFWAGTLEDELMFFNEQPGNSKLSVRIGTFCNPGVDKVCSNHGERYLANRLLNAKSATAFAYEFPEKNKRRPQAIPQGIKNDKGNYPGGMRVSLGIASSFNDIYTFLQFVHTLAGKYEDDTSPAV